MTLFLNSTISTTEPGSRTPCFICLITSSQTRLVISESPRKLPKKLLHPHLKTSTNLNLLVSMVQRMLLSFSSTVMNQDLSKDLALVSNITRPLKEMMATRTPAIALKERMSSSQLDMRGSSTHTPNCKVASQALSLAVS